VSLRHRAHGVHPYQAHVTLQPTTTKSRSDYCCSCLYSRAGLPRAGRAHGGRAGTAGARMSHVTDAAARVDACHLISLSTRRGRRPRQLSLISALSCTARHPTTVLARWHRQAAVAHITPDSVSESGYIDISFDHILSPNWHITLRCYCCKQPLVCLERFFITQRTL